MRSRSKKNVEKDHLNKKTSDSSGNVPVASIYEEDMPEFTSMKDVSSERSSSESLFSSSGLEDETQNNLFRSISEEDKVKIRKESVHARLYDAINDGRMAVYDVIDGMMMEVFREVYGILMDGEYTSELIYAMDGPVCGISRVTLAEILSCSSEGLAEYVLGPTKARLESQFLDVTTLSRNSFRTSYPQAFKKWEKEEDELLKKLFYEGASWFEISAALRRNVNAVKIRAERLGLSTDTGAKMRFQSYRSM